MAERLDITRGTKFGKLTLLREGPRHVFPGGQTQRTFICRCECGSKKRYFLTHLRQGRSTTCGLGPCKETSMLGRSKHPLYNAWLRLNWRCYDKNDPAFEDYGGRGIRVCKAWSRRLKGPAGYDNFWKWAHESGWKRGLQIDRIDNDGSYRPSNCRWATPSRNSRNRRSTIFISFRGQLVQLLDLLEREGHPSLLAKPHVFRWRLSKGWEIDRALSVSVRPKRR